MANITGTTLPHRAMADTSLCGFEIKKNCTLVANLQSVHMDKEHWGDPKVFRPERFIDETGQFADDPWLMPFGFGSLLLSLFFIFIIHINIYYIL